MSTERPEDHRRKWDKDEFEKIATERLKAELEEEDKSKKKGKVHFIIIKHRYVFLPVFNTNTSKLCLYIDITCIPVVSIICVPFPLDLAMELNECSH